MTENQIQEMEMLNFFKKFRTEEDGAVTVDWVVLTASVVGLAVGGVVMVKDGVDGLAGNIGTELSSATVTGIGELGQGTQEPTAQ